MDAVGALCACEPPRSGLAEWLHAPPAEAVPLAPAGPDIGADVGGQIVVGGESVQAATIGPSMGVAEQGERRVVVWSSGLVTLLDAPSGGLVSPRITTVQAVPGAIVEARAMPDGSALFLHNEHGWWRIELAPQALVTRIVAHSADVEGFCGAFCAEP